MSRSLVVAIAAACGLAACGGKASMSDPDQAEKLRPLTAKGATLRVAQGPLARVGPGIERICADNAKRANEARELGADDDLVDQVAADRLARRIAAVPRPTDADVRYTAWTDSLKTVANLLRLAAEADGDKADALRDQAQRTTDAGRRTAGQLGLRACAAD